MIAFIFLTNVHNISTPVLIRSLKFILSSWNFIRILLTGTQIYFFDYFGFKQLSGSFNSSMFDWEYL